MTTEKDSKRLVTSEESNSANDSSNKCGIVMPIAGMDGYSESHWKDVKRIIELAIKSAGFEPRLVSDADDIGVIHKRIVQNLYDNPMIVCDISGRNPNVMFELGLRLAFDKPTIIVKDEITPYSFDTSVIEHLSYPKDLRYNKIEIFKEELKDRIQKTYKAYQADPDNYSTFLKNYGAFKTPIINEETVSIDRYVLDELKNIQKSVSHLSKSVDNTNGSRRANIKPSYISLSDISTSEKMTFILDGIHGNQELSIDIHEALAKFGSAVKNISFQTDRIYITVQNTHPAFDMVEEVISEISSLGYEVEELEENVYRMSKDRA